MLYFHHGNDLHRLADHLAVRLQPPLRSPLAAEQILVPSRGLGRWLGFRLTDRLGLCAHTQFRLPASFLWQLVAGISEQPEGVAAYAPEVLAFRLYAWLASPAAQAVPRLAPLLAEDDARQRWSLAHRIADAFDHYLLYRADWLATWEQGRRCGLGEDEDWQARLWQELTAVIPGPHRARLLTALLDRLQSATPPPGLPERLSLFGFSSLPPIWLQLLLALGRHTDVHLYALNPCQEYWGDLRDPREILRLPPRHQVEQPFLDVPQPLLAALGKQGMQFFDLVIEHLPQLDDDFVCPARDSLLHRLQADVLTLSTPKPPEAIAADDDSVQIHACHSPLREVEVLHDQLLALFAAHPGLSPADVVVLTPDIEQYAPLIDAVFAPLAGAVDRPAIPYTIADRGQRAEAPLLESFLDLLGLPDWRFTPDQVMGLLTVAAIRRCFDLDDADRVLLTRWLQDAGIHWGRDAEHRARLGLPALAEHSWRAGLDRLLLGFALPGAVAGAQPPLWHEVLPWDDVEGFARPLAGLSSLIDQLGRYADRLAQPQSPADWLALLGELIDAFFQPEDDADLAALTGLRAALVEFRDQATLAGFDAPLPIAVIRQWAQQHLDDSSRSTGFLTGAVTFGTMVPMRSLPFRVIAVLGLNDGEFPRRQSAAGFDLMSQHPRIGDRSRQQDDRYLFLETLLSARDVLYLSYVGRDIRDDSERPPSTLVAQLLDVIRQGYQLDGRDPTSVLVRQHALQPFNPRYFQANTAARWPGHSRLWAEAAALLGTADAPLPALASTPLPTPALDALTLTELCRFWRSPVRAFLRERLGIPLARADELPAGDEPFALDRNSREAVSEALLRWPDQPDQAQRLARAAGLLPQGEPGRAQADSVQRALNRLWTRHDLARHLGADLVPDVQAETTVQCIRLSATFPDLRTNGHTRIHLHKDSAADLLSAWLNHLLLQFSPAPEPTTWLLFSNQAWRWPPLAPATAALYLDQLLSHLQAGLQQPLPFAPRSALAYAQKHLKTDDVDAAVQEARKTWQGGFMLIGDSSYPEQRYLWRDSDPLAPGSDTLARFCTVAEDVFGPALTHREDWS